MQKRFLRTTFAAAILAAALPALGAKPRLDIRAYQQPDGLVATFKSGTVADPYFGMYGLELAARAGLDVTDARNRLVQWGLRHQQASGRFPRFCRDADPASASASMPRAPAWRACGRADSDDATLSRWLVLLMRAAPPGPLPAAWQLSYDKAWAVLETLRMSNGVYSVFPPGTPGYEGYALFKDNVEVLDSLRALATLHASRGEPELGRALGARAEQLAGAMAEHFGAEPTKLERLALGANYARASFYPHKVAVPFAWLEGYASPEADQWQVWLNENTAAWDANAKADFPWGLVAVAAGKAGRYDVGCRWLERYRVQRKADVRWNVLEEISAQVVQHQLTLQTSPCPTPGR